jgi:hypothetical protein
MTSETTVLGLRDRAREAAEEFAQAVRERAARDQAEYTQRAKRTGASVFQQVLGVDTAPEEWIPAGDGSGNYHSATAEVDGLKFLAVETYAYDAGYLQRLYLLRGCESPQHPPHDEQTEVQSLADLHDALQDGNEGRWSCLICSQHAYEEREDRAAQAPAAEPEPTPAEQLVAALAALIRQELTAAQERGEF